MKKTENRLCKKNMQPIIYKEWSKVCLHRVSQDNTKACTRCHRTRVNSSLTPPMVSFRVGKNMQAIISKKLPFLT